MARWIIHLSDGTTLTEADKFPHEVDSELVTSVERVISGNMLTIKKSPLIEDFFIGTEEGLDFRMGRRHKAPPIVTKRMIGCYIKETEPPLQARLVMDPRTLNTVLRFIRVKKKTKRGINANPVSPRRQNLEVEHVKEVMGHRYAIAASEDVARCFNTPIGLGCLLKKPKIRAELILKNRSVLLGFTPPGQKLKAV